MAINIRFTAQEQEVIKALKAMGGETAKLVDENIKLANQFARTDAEAKFYARGIGRVKAEAEAAKLAQDKLTDSTNKLTAAQAKQANSRREAIANGIASAVGFQFGGPASGIGGAIGGLQGAAIGASVDALVALGKEVSDVTERYNRLQIALDSATGSSEMGARAFGFIVNLAVQTGQRIETLGASYKTLAANARGTVLEGAGVERIFAAITKAGSGMQLSNEQIKGSLKAIGDMMNKGKIQAEELTQQFSENFPGGAKIFADALGISTAELFKLGEQGKLLATDVLPKVAEYLEKTSKGDYAKNLGTITGSMNLLRNETDLLLVAFGRDTQINTFFSAIIRGSANALNAIRGLTESQGFSSILRFAYDPFGASLQGQLANVKGGFNDGFLKKNLTERNNLIGKMAKEAIELEKKIDSNFYNNAGARDKAKQELESKKKDINDLIILNKKATEDELKKVSIASKLSAVKKEQQKSEAELGSAIKETARIIAEGRVGNKGYDSTADGIKKLGELESLKSQLISLQEISKMPSKAKGKESAFAKQIREENEAGKDLFKERLEIIKQASIDAERLANFPTAFSSSPIDAVMPLFGGKKVADIQTGFGNDLLQTGKLRDRFAEMLKTSLSNLDINPENIRIEPTITLKETTIEKARGKIETYFNDLGGIWEDNAGQFSDIVSNGIGNALQSGFAGLGNAIATGENPFSALGEGIVGAFGDMLIQVGQLMLAQAGVLLAASILSGGALGAEFAKALAGGAALTTAGSAMKAVKFAEGGIVSGRTFAEVGEYRGARNNPEVIAPLNKLGTIFTPFFQRAVSMGRVNQPKLAMQPVTTTTNVYMDGKVLLQQLDRTILRQGRI